MDRVVCAGILVADTFCGPMERVPNPGELIQVGPFVFRSGGCAANTAICLAKQNVPSLVAGKVGQDVAGQAILEDLAGGGIDVSSVSRSETSPTSQTFILICEGEDRRFVHSFGANAEFNAEDLEQAVAPGAVIVYVGGFMALPNLRADRLAEVLGRAKKQGATTVLDVVVPAHLEDMGSLWQVLPSVDVFLPNEDEARKCTGLDDGLDQAMAMRARGAGTVVLTMGERGALVVGADGCSHVAAVPVECVDPSGGGDAFAAGLIKGLVQDWPMTKAVQLGAVLGASCVQAVGCHDSVFDEQSALRVLAETPPPVEAI